MKTPEQYVEDMKYVCNSGIVFWEPVHMANVIRKAQKEAALMAIHHLQHRVNEMRPSLMGRMVVCLDAEQIVDEVIKGGEVA